METNFASQDDLSYLARAYSIDRAELERLQTMDEIASRVGIEKFRLVRELNQHRSDAFRIQYLEQKQVTGWRAILFLAGMVFFCYFLFFLLMRSVGVFAPNAAEMHKKVKEAPPAAGHQKEDVVEKKPRM